MIRICFVCLGNICRSPMAEFIFKNMVYERGLQDCFFICSKGTSSEELGNPMHPGTILELERHHIPYTNRYASKLERKHYHEFDYFIGMDAYNISSMIRIFGRDAGHKVYRMLDFCDNKKDIDDPWYTGDFSLTYQEITLGCQAFLDYIIKKNAL